MVTGNIHNKSFVGTEKKTVEDLSLNRVSNLLFNFFPSVVDVPRCLYSYEFNEQVEFQVFLLNI